ncbi:MULTISPECIES: PAS domain-containing hybrid sensor histidine kinase/response regulator [unclassified Rhizobium]|uniref:hybrid sensor histidine kinase/response regulator n=1 Tax=unclassified Rhizobium TaxID=2613769 RepID=UPI000CDF309F|nr:MULTISPECIES: PAS domain-containing hybrid sensor histidine kinase/response regulator [Rhizobium]AVA20128.1 sensor histidine kinase/response regulator hybrid protein [Rhizobium sp. NXC24]MDK4740751.1 ATP-binding protein [Rhizobium sp. CNPSo 3464]UWU21431.1 ATP-binding protein [Rhizobium tropici]
MSTLANLQEKLVAATTDDHDAPRERPVGGTPLMATGPIEISPANRPDTSPSDFSLWLHRHWLNGGGLIAGVALMSVGYAGGPLALAGLLGLIALAIVGAGVLHRRHAARKVIADMLALSEHEHDRLWESNESTSLLATIHDALGDITVTRDIERRIVHANATFRNLTGKSNPEGLTLEEAGLVFRVATDSQRQDAEISTPEGPRIFAWHDVMFRDPATGQLRIQSVARDVTEERQAARLREEARLKAEYNSAAKSRLLATVSHEIRTPLSGILGMNHLLAQTPLTLEQANYLTGIRQSGNALVQLVEDLLDFSTIEVGRFQLRPRAEHLRPLLEGVVEMLAHRAHEKGIEIAATVAADVPETMEFDPARLRQVLFNVIGNAVKFTQTGGVLIRAGLDGDDLVISVRDSGPGMTEEEQARIFGEFEQAGNVLDRSAGTGLGLAISARILREFGGTLNVSSARGEGSEFTVRFPISVVAAENEPARRSELLKGSRVLLLAPEGAASTAIAGTIRTLGGHCRVIGPDDVKNLAQSAPHDAGMSLTDIIVDHRMAPWYFREGTELAALGLRKIFLVNPEERNTHPLDLFDAWLIRPLREQSLIDVLSGRMRGMEKRDVLSSPPQISLVTPEAADAALNVLLGEDDPVNAMLVRAMLAKAGHRVRLVEDFDNLLARAENSENRPDVVVTDLTMPGGEGAAMLAQLRALERRYGLSPLPVIVLTADSRDAIRRQALLSGADAVIVKPVDPDRLIAEVQGLSKQAFGRA